MSRRVISTLLYVDDEPDIREIVHLALGMVKDLDVQTCDSGAGALVLMRANKTDLVLLDAMMPGMDGPTTLSRMRADPALAGIPVIFLTAKAMPQEIARFRDLGAAGIIAKPFDPMLLGQQVISLWEDMADD